MRKARIDVSANAETRLTGGLGKVVYILFMSRLEPADKSKREAEECNHCTAAKLSVKAAAHSPLWTDGRAHNKATTDEFHLNRCDSVNLDATSTFQSNLLLITAIL